MELNIYAIKDELAGTYGNLMVVNPKVAKRTFKWMAQEMEKAECDDKRIYLMAKYDNERGTITQDAMPEMVYNLEEEKKNEDL